MTALRGILRARVVTCPHLTMQFSQIWGHVSGDFAKRTCLNVAQPYWSRPSYRLGVRHQKPIFSVAIYNAELTNLVQIEFTSQVIPVLYLTFLEGESEV